MRVPGRKIYRAFAELDRFSDEQCARFVRAANRGFWWGCLRFLVWASCGVTVLAVVVLGVGFLTGRWQRWFGDDVVELVGDMSPWWAGVLVVPLLFMVMRDGLLARRIRSVLATRGTCGGCRYGLLGLPVDERMLVICPECGTQTKVDESLGELTLDAEGKARFQPSVDAISTGRRFWTPRRKKWGIRGGIAAALVFVVLPLGVVGVREVLLMVQAGEARADREKFRKEWEALLEESQPAGSSAQDPNAWTIFATIVDEHDAAFKALMQRDSERNPTGAVPMPDLIYRPSTAPVDSGDAVAFQTMQDRYREDQKSRELGLELVEQLKRDGAFEQMAEMAARPRALFPLDVDWTRPLSDVMFPMLGKCRALLRVNTARMYLARQKGDVEEFVRAAEANLALIRMARCGPNLICQLVASAMLDVTFAQCREYFASGAPENLAGKLLEAMRRQRSESRYGYGIHGDRLSTDDTIAWLFGEPSHVRFGMRSQAVMAMVGSRAATAPIWKSSIGSYRANGDAADACFNEAEARQGLESWERGASTEDAREYPLVEALLFGFGAIMNAKDHELLKERSFELVLQIEEFRSKHGTVPESLQEFAGLNGGAMIRDPQTGAAFGYVRQSEFDSKSFPDPQFDDASRAALARQGYLLFSAGPDRVIDFVRDGKVLIPADEVVGNSLSNGVDVLLTPVPPRPSR